MTQRVQMMFITATTLPLLVALAEIGLRSGTMLPQNAAALVGAGVLSVIVYPAVAVAIAARRAAREHAAPASPGPSDEPPSTDRVRRGRLPWARPASLAHRRTRRDPAGAALTRPRGDQRWPGMAPGPG